MSREPAVTQRGEHRVPELRALGLGDPHPEGVLAALDVDADDQVRDLHRDRALVPDLDADPVDVDDRVHLVDRPVLPQGDLIGHHLGDIRDQLPGRFHAIDFEQMCLDVARRQAAGVERQDHLVDHPRAAAPVSARSSVRTRALRSRGTSRVTGPFVVEIVLREVPLREFPDPAPAGSSRS